MDLSSDERRSAEFPQADSLTELRAVMHSRWQLGGTANKPLAETTQVQSTDIEMRQRLSALEQSLIERTRRLSALEATLEERTGRILAVERALEERHRRIASL